MTVTVHPASALAGRVRLPADKSVAHRAAILAAAAQGRSTITGFSDAADPQSTLACLRALGVNIETQDDGTLVIDGRGLDGLRAPDGPLDCGNSGTTMRLLAGLLAGRPFATTLVGDASLSARPMERIADPLRQMGAHIETTDGHAPLTVGGGSTPLAGITYRLPVASAQVKSAVLLAGLSARGSTTVVEPIATRDHTERMLELPVLHLGTERHVTIDGSTRVQPRQWVVPRDVSAAVFFVVAGSIAEHAIIEMHGVGLNPTRTAALDVLRAMGARFTIIGEREVGGEPIGDLRIEAPANGLHGVEIGGDLVPNLIDEIPVLAIAAAYARGRTLIRDASELRAKETDRIEATAAVLRALGATVEPRPDGLVIDGRGGAGGPPLAGGSTVDAHGDHRIAMAAAIGALACSRPTTIHGAEHAAVSFPGFWDALDGVAAGAVEPA